MIKHTTLIVLVCALVLGGAVYYFNTRQAKETKPSDASSPLFSMQSSDVTGMAISHPAKPEQPAIQFKKTGDEWQIVQPIETGADQLSVEGIVDQISAGSVSQTEPGTPDRLKAYGLDPAQVSVQLQLKDGKKHTILMGNKDFTGDDVYSIVDGAKTVSLLPQLLLASCDKSADDLRDKSVLHANGEQLASFTLKNGSGEMAAAKVKDQWQFSEPENAPADADAIQSLLTGIENAKMASIVSEKPDDLAKYGLTNPAIAFTSKNDVGKESTLVVGKKAEGGKGADQYYGRDLSRPTIFSINDDLHMQLAKTFADLRDKKLAHFDPADITHAEIHDSHGAIVADSTHDGEWKIESPTADKGKTASYMKIFDPITGLTADQIIDRPSASLTGPLAKPAIKIDLTDKNGKKITLAMSKPMGDFFYARTSDSPVLYKIKKEEFDGLDEDAGQLLQ